MLNYAIKRINGALLVVVAVSVITFVMLTQISGNAAMLALGTDATAEQLAQLEHSLGLDLPWYLQYLGWVKICFIWISALLRSTVKMCSRWFCSACRSRFLWLCFPC